MKKGGRDCLGRVIPDACARNCVANDIGIFDSRGGFHTLMLASRYVDFHFFDFVISKKFETELKRNAGFA